MRSFLPQNPACQLALLVILLIAFSLSPAHGNDSLRITGQGYLHMPGLSIFPFTDEYAEGHQGGIQIIRHEIRLAANGDLRLEPAPGQWQPFSQTDTLMVDRKNKRIRIELSYPNHKAQTRTFNRIEYPDLDLSYSIDVIPEGRNFRIVVNLDKPLPREWVGKVGFNLELFPGAYFGEHYLMDGQAGLFPRQFDGPVQHIEGSQPSVPPLATGRKLILAPGSEDVAFTIESVDSDLQLIDGRAEHSNGWFIVRSLLPAKTRDNALEWIIKASPDENWFYDPVIHVNQLGYMPLQEKYAIIETDLRDTTPKPARLLRWDDDGQPVQVLESLPSNYESFGRYGYYRFDFTMVRETGIYQVLCGDQSSSRFMISDSVYGGRAWHPVISTFLPVQMCHMRVNDRYRVWHGLCHMDDARMAIPGTLHFDGYHQGDSTLTVFEGGEHVPGLNTGGWHDAGDYDLRVETQASTIYALSLIYETFDVRYDETMIDQEHNLVELHQPDGKPDILQQIEHGVRSILAGYYQLDRLYRGIICPELRQYVLLGDGSVMTNNIPYNSDYALPEWIPDLPDDRLVFTEHNPKRELYVAGCMAAASRILREYDEYMAKECLALALDIRSKYALSSEAPAEQVNLDIELYLTTGWNTYLNEIIGKQDFIYLYVDKTGWQVARVLKNIEDQGFRRGFTIALQKYYTELERKSKSNPFGIPYEPRTWGAGWDLQRQAVEHYFLYTHLKNPASRKYLFNALNFNMGIHPGMNESSYISGVGTKSATVAYGLNRADWSYIPGGVVSGTALIRPDFPELKDWPFLWQQAEYMIGGAASNMVFLLLAAQQLGNM